MNQALKQRLVGAAVLIALGVIFLPALFNGGRPHTIDPLKDMPPAPDISPAPVIEPKPVAALAAQPKKNVSSMYELAPKNNVGESNVGANSAANNNVGNKNAANSTAKLVTPSLDSRSMPNAWVLQAGVFTDATKANSLKKSLQAKGYKAFVRSTTHDGKTMNRVLIGPEMDQKKLATLRTAVDKEFQLNCITVKFEP